MCTKQEAEKKARELADEEGQEFFIIEDCGQYRAAPIRPEWGRVVGIVEPRRLAMQ